MTQNLYFITFRRISVVMLLFSLGRLLFYVFNRSYYPDIDAAGLLGIFLGGLRFDTSAVLYTNLLYLVLFLLPFNFRYNTGFQRFQKIQYLFFNIYALILNSFDTAFFSFTKRRTTFSIFKEFSHGINWFEFAKNSLLNFWYLYVVLAGLIYLLVVCYEKPIAKPNYTKPLKYYGIGTLLFLVFSGLIIAGLRGGFAESTRPITLSNAGEYCTKPLEMALVLNTPFSIYKTIEVNYLEEKKYYSDTQLEAIYNPVQMADTTQPFKKLNVVVIVLESFGREYIGALNTDLDGGRYKGYTPFLDSLIGQSKTFWWGFANGEKSIDALPSATTSIPYIQEPYVTSPYAASNTINSIASLLKPEGYQTAFFHGAPNGSMGFWAFLRQVGFDAYFGKDEYNNDADYDGVWGIWDEPFLQFMVQKLNTFKQPFVATAFTLSSHDPNKVPAAYEGKFPKGTLPVHQCVGYSDMALRKFFATASKSDWYKNTLFVLTADHTNQAHYPQYKTEAGIFRIPIIFFQPNSNLKGLEKGRIVQQIDILPTVLNYLHFNKSFVSFGKNGLSNKTSNWAFNYNNGTYQYYKNQYMLQWRDDKAVALYDFKTDLLLKTNLLNTNKNIADSLETDFKAFYQQFTSRVINNRLTIDK